MAIINADNISFSYPDGIQALEKVTFKIEKGKKVSVHGENGSGKTTLFLILNGLLKADSGKVSVNGHNCSKSKLKDIVSQVGVTFQNPDIQLFAPTVFQEISFGPVNLGFGKNKILQTVNNAMDKTGLKNLKDRPTQYLSYGQKKKVAAASILAMETEILIFDEPFAWLDMKGREDMNRIFDKLIDDGKTVIISTHDTDFSWGWSDQVLLFKEGKLLASGSPDNILTNRELLARAEIAVPSVVDIWERLEMEIPCPRELHSLLNIIVEHNC